MMQKPSSALQLKSFVRWAAVAAVLLTVGVLVADTAPRWSLRLLCLTWFGVAGVAEWSRRRLASAVQSVASQAERITSSDLTERLSPPSPDKRIDELVEVVNRLLDRSESSFADHERFIADVSHEFRTPLSVLLGEAQVLSQRQRSPEEYRHFIASVEEEMRRLAQLVSSLLTLARAHAGFPLPDPTRVYVNEVTVEAVQRCETLAQARNVRLVLELAFPEAEATDAVVLGDVDLIRSMLSNIVRNAIRFSPDGAAVRIQVELCGKEAIVCVSDEGPGVDPQHIPRLFDRFYQASSPESSSGSYGLGLAIAKAVVELHHGKIEVSRPKDGGAAFLVRLPRNVPQAD